MRSHIRAYAVGVSVMLFAATASGLQWNVSGEAGTARFWDCCKPSCAWKFKADVNQPVEACAIDGLTRENVEAGTGCNGGKAFQCTDQQPWAVNDTFSYGFAGAYLMEASNELEDAWCCACYQLEFTSDPLLGKTMIVQASNTAYDIHDANWFPLAVSLLEPLSNMPLLTIFSDTRRQHQLYRWLCPPIQCPAKRLRRSECWSQLPRGLQEITRAAAGGL